VFWDDADDVERLEGVATDITERRESARRQREAAAILDNTPEGVIVTDDRERILMVNRAFQSLSGYEEVEVLGRNVGLLDATEAANPWAAIRQRLESSGYWQGELTSRRKDGEVFPELRSISHVVAPEGEADHVVHLFTDMSRLKATEKRLDFLAQHDALTDLPNRGLLLAHMRERIGTPGAGTLDVLKIDKRFVDDLAENNDDREIASVILAMGHALRLSVIAEGVETAEQLAFLENKGCDNYQGYFYSPPLPAPAFARLLAEG